MVKDAFLAASPYEIYKACDIVFEGEPWIAWEPETLLTELRKNTSEAAEDKLMAVQAFAANSQAAFKNANAFENVVNAFCNNICVVDTVQPPYVEEMVYAVRQMELIFKAVHGDDKEMVFSGTVPGYIAATAHYRGWVVLPASLSAAQPQLDFLTGLSPKSVRYQENKAVLDAVSKLHGKLTKETAEKFLTDPGMARLMETDKFVQNALGAVLFDPTLPYYEEDRSNAQ